MFRETSLQEQVIPYNSSIIRDLELILNAAQGGNVLIDGINDIVTDGIHFTVSIIETTACILHDNRVAISDVESDILPIKLTHCD